MITLTNIKEARERIQKYIRRTLPEHSTTLSKMSGFDIWLKPECLQRTGSFKIRGALNRVLSLSPEEGRRGIVTASSGNHGQAVACAAGILGYAAAIIMPEGGSKAKSAAISGYGSEVLFCGTRSEERMDLAYKMCKERGMIMVHPYDDPYVMAGQGTIGLEILEDIRDAAAVLVPTGGCGLISGIAAAIKETNPGVKVFGIEPEGSNSTGLSFHAGKRTSLDVINTMADGIRTTIPGEHTFPVVQKYVDEMYAVTEEKIAEATRLILERCKILAEPTGAVTTAAVLTPDLLPKSLAGKKVVPLVSGGNIALYQLAEIIKN